MVESVVARNIFIDAIISSMTIPKEAKRVFKGVIFDVYQWEQEMFDGSRATFEALKRPYTVQVIPVMDGRILLSYEEQPHYSRKYAFLGGRTEEREEPLAAAKRELHEEAGIDASIWEFYKTYIIGGKIDWNIYFYIAKNCQKVAEPHLDPGERIDVKAVSFEEFINVVTDESFGDVQFANDIFRMREQGMLDDFRQKLLS